MKLLNLDPRPQFSNQIDDTQWWST